MKRPGLLASTLVVGMIVVTVAAVVSQLDRKHPDPFISALTGAAGHLSYHMAAGVDPDSRDEQGLSLLHLALGEEGSYEAVQVLVASGASVEAPSAGEIPLGRAVAMGRLREAALFLEKGADPNGRDSLGRCPLHRHQGRGPAPMIVLELLEAGARLDDRDASGRSVRDHLLTLGDPRIERLLAGRSAPR